MDYKIETTFEVNRRNYHSGTLFLGLKRWKPVGTYDSIEEVQAYLNQHFGEQHELEDIRGNLEKVLTFLHIPEWGSGDVITHTDIETGLTMTQNCWKLYEDGRLPRSYTEIKITPKISATTS